MPVRKDLELKLRTSTYVPFDAARKEQFVEALALTGSFTQAGEAAGVSHTTSANHRNPECPYFDLEFKRRCDDALEKFRDVLRQEVYRRAVTGVEEPVYYRGDQVGTVRKYSDRLLELMLKRHDPGYRFSDPASINVDARSISLGGMMDLSLLTTEQQDLLRQLIAKAQPPPPQIVEGETSDPAPVP